MSSLTLLPALLKELTPSGWAPLYNSDANLAAIQHLISANFRLELIYRTDYRLTYFAKGTPVFDMDIGCELNEWEDNEDEEIERIALVLRTASRLLNAHTYNLTELYNGNL